MHGLQECLCAWPCAQHCTHHTRWALAHAACAYSQAPACKVVAHTACAHCTRAPSVSACIACACVQACGMRLFVSHMHLCTTRLLAPCVSAPRHSAYACVPNARLHAPHVWLHSPHACAWCFGMTPTCNACSRRISCTCHLRLLHAPAHAVECLRACMHRTCTCAYYTRLCHRTRLR